MATGTTDFTRIPPSTQANAEVLKDLFPDLPWGYLEAYPRPAADRTVQVRSEMTDRTRKATARKYKADMKAGDKFPALLVSKDGWVLDGLHRREALEELDISSFHVIMIDRNYQNAPTALRDRLTMLVAKLNQRNGDKMSRREVENLVASLSGDNSPSDVAKITGVAITTVKDIMNAQKAVVRARSLGLDLGTVPRTTLKHVGLRLNEYTEPVFTELTGLLKNTPITSNEATQVLDRLAQAGTEDKKLALLAKEREGRALQERGIRTTRTPAQQARMHWAYFLSHEDDPSAMVELNDVMSAEHLNQAWRVISTLRKMVAAQTALASEGYPKE